MGAEHAMQGTKARAGWRLALLSGLGLAALLAGPRPARAADEPPPPPVTVSVRDTFDLWRNASGGVDTGNVVLNKLQLSATLRPKPFGLDGLRLHAQIFVTNGPSLSEKVGDVQTVSNIEAPTMARLFEAWAEQAFGKEDAGGGEIRAGLIDLNSEFDSIDPASLLINSSQGIGPDLSKSGRNGPSIFPVSSLGMTGQWTPSGALALHAGVFDGLPGDPAHPRRFVAAHLGGGAGALLIAQADVKPARDLQISFGAWRYTADLRVIGGGGAKQADSGLYGFVEGPLPHVSHWSGWVRVGASQGAVQTVSAYAGAGVIGKSGRKDDTIGFAIAHAIIGDPSRRLGLPSAETTFEATYQTSVADHLAIQPDLQYVIHPAGRPGLPNAFVMGLRLVFHEQYPGRKGRASDYDATVAPD